MTVDVGTVLGNRYQLQERIATGGMGEVWRGDDEVLARSVAVKLLRPEHASDPEFVERFRAEARHAAALSHPGIAAVYDYGETTTGRGPAAYLVMELVDGEPLADLLNRVGPLPVERTLTVVGQAAEALQAAHDAGVIHRDVKPSNILLRPDGTGVALTDFGIARATNDPGHLTRTGLVVGTATYLSPEQASGRPTTPASDVYSLGVVAYQCLTGSPPFGGENPVQVAVAHLRDEVPPLPADLPAGVAALVLGMLAKEPDDRPASAGSVARAATALLADPDRVPVFPAAPEAAAAAAATSAASAATAGVAAAASEAGTEAPPTTVLEPAALGADADTDAPRPRWRGDAYPDQRRTRNLMLLAGLVVVVVGAVLLALVGGDNHSTKRRTASSPTPTAPATQRLAASAFIGKPYADVRRSLLADGLAVHRTDLESTAPAGTVIAIMPVGRVPLATTVTVTVAAAPPPPGPGKVPPGHKPGHGPGHKHGHGEGSQGD